ncbi:MAG TPA: hypothetical protein VLK23_06300 [Thermodesulfobacteriota bacterium]|nr:hypothetical protein [Thermodesulfobacteriota bacterium]
MRPGRKAVLLMAGLIFSMTVSSPAFAKTAGYCLECHPKKFIETFYHHFEQSNGDSRNVYQMKLDPCPGLRSLSEELFFTESRIVKLNQILRTLEQDGWSTDGLKKGVAESAGSFSELKEYEKVSIQQFTREASAIRTVLQKVYDRTLQSRGETSRRCLIGLGALFFLGLLILIGLGYRKLGRMGRSLLVSFVIGGMFSLTACTPSPSEREKSPGQERLEQSLSLATEITRQMEETFNQSCLLAEMSREWSKMEPASAKRGFQLAWHLSMAAREKAGEIKPLKELALQWTDRSKASKEKIDSDTVLDLRDELWNSEGRTWALRTIAEEWVQVNPKAGRSALELATKEALAMEDLEVRDRELKSISEAWAGIDEIRSLEVSHFIKDPFLKALTLARVALSVNGKDKGGNLLREAWQVAESIPPSYSQSKAMIQVSVTAAKLFPQEKNTWMDRVLLRIQNLKPEQLKAFALQGLVFHWVSLDIEQAKRLAMEIPPAYPEERAYALIHLAKNKGNSKVKALTLLKEVSAEMVKISDPFIAQKVKGLIAKELAIIEPREAFQILPQIEDPFYRSEILGALALRISSTDKRKALELAERIPLEFFRIQSAVAIIRQWMDREQERVNALHQEAFQAATTIADPYSRALILIELGKSWGRIDRRKELKLLEMALGSAEKISSPWMKAESIEALSEAMKNSDKARAQALIDGMEPSVFRSRKSLEEVRRWAPVDPEKAKQLAEAFPPHFPMEKAMAFKEAAGGFKKGQPLLAFDLCWRAIDQVLMLPEEHKGRKLLSSLVTEAARLNKEGTLQRLLQISKSDTRDILLKEAGSFWAQEDPSFALKAAGEILEGSLRFVLYQKIAAHEAKKLSRPGKSGTEQPVSLAFSQWGLGREKAKKDESQAVPYYEKTLQEIKKMKDLKERSYLLGGLAAEWATVDEEKALKIAEEVPSEFSESLSFSLLQIGIQLKKWNRKGAEALFQKAVSSAVQIRDHRLRGRRLFQIGHQWQGIDKGKGKEVLIMAENEVRKSVSSPEKGDPLLTEVLVARLRTDPQSLLKIFQNTDPPVLRAKVFLEQGKIETKEVLEENIKTLEKAFQYAQKTKQPRLLREAALAWYALDPDRGIEMTGQIESREIRVKTLCQMARRNGPLREEESKHLLERTFQEAILIPGLTERIKALKAIAETGMVVDKEQAKAIYQMTYRMIEKTSF